MKPRRWLVACLGTAIAASATLASQSADIGVLATLTQRFGVTPAERNTLTAGYEMVRPLKAAARDGVSAMGAIWIDARPSVYLAWAEEFAEVDRGSAVRAVRKLSDPPVLADFDTLTLSAAELRELPRCRIGACGLQLDELSIRRIAAIDWNRPQARTEATAVFRAMMLAIARAYTDTGDASLRPYRDSKHDTDVPATGASLIQDEAAMGAAPPELIAALRSRPADAPPRAISYLSWTTNTFGLKPTTRLNHTIVYRTPGSGVAGVIATKQIYASHYFHGGLEMRYVVANPALDDRFALVMVTRARADGLTGLSGALFGDTIRRRSLHSLRTYLWFTKESIEKRQRRGWTEARR